MISVAEFFYNFALLVLFTMVMSFAMSAYAARKQAPCLPIITLFLFYLLDTAIIYMTEIIPSAGDWYDTIFMSVPTFKTIIYIVTALCLFQLRNTLFARRFSSSQVGVLIALGLWYLFIPMMANSAMKVWLYYFAYQVFTFCFSLITLRTLAAQPIASDALRKSIVLFLKLTLLFSVLIAVEDSIVIFNLDIYSRSRIYIHDRNHCEDVLRICYSIILLRVFYRERASIFSAPAPTAPAIPPSAPSAQPEATRGILSDPRTAAFAGELRLTGRESEILVLLLENADNQEISRQLCISIGTVKTHVHNIFQKADVEHRYELIRKYETFSPPES